MSATTTSPSAPGMASYLTLMREVKLRGEIIEGILTRQLTLIYDQPTVEALFLQLRLVLESIALGSLVAHQEDFDNMRAKMRAHHKPIGLLNALEKHHPKSYPEPVIQASGECMIKTNLVPRPDDYLTKTEFESCYGACSEYLHVTSPLVGDNRINANEALTDASFWYMRIHNLLNNHLIHPIGGQEMYLIQMAAPHELPSSTAFGRLDSI